MATIQSRASTVAAVLAACAIVMLTSASRVHSQAQPAQTSTDGVWQTVDVGAPVAGAAARQISIPSGSVVRLNRAAFEQVTTAIRNTPVEQGAIITLPMPDGSFARFRANQSRILDPSLAAQFP